MSSVSVNATHVNICEYIFTHRTKAGTKCVNPVTKRDTKGLFCCHHYKKSSPQPKPIETPKEESPQALVVKTVDEIEREAREKRWEERYLKEREHQREEMEYRTWRNKRSIRP